MALQVDLLQTSFRMIAAQGEAFTAAFYDRLFQRCPETKPLFADTDLALQYRKLLGALTLVIDYLRDPEILTPLLHDLGERHLTAYRVQPEDLTAAGGALLETFAVFLGAQWTRELQEAWTGAYSTIVERMLEDAAPGQQTVVP